MALPSPGGKCGDNILTYAGVPQNRRRAFSSSYAPSPSFVHFHNILAVRLFIPSLLPCLFHTLPPTRVTVLCCHSHITTRAGIGKAWAWFPSGVQAFARAFRRIERGLAGYRCRLYAMAAYHYATFVRVRCLRVPSLLQKNTRTDFCNRTAWRALYG